MVARLRVYLPAYTAHALSILFLIVREIYQTSCTGASRYRSGEWIARLDDDHASAGGYLCSD